MGGIPPPTSSFAVELQTISSFKVIMIFPLSLSVINKYISLMRKEQKSVSRQCYFFDTYFYPLHVENYKAGDCRRWSEKIREEMIEALSNSEMVFMPVHRNNNHWALLVIERKGATAKHMYLDSLLYDGLSERARLFQLYSDMMFLMYEDEAPSYIKAINPEDVKDIPKQTNGFDCGVFMLKYIDVLRQNLPLGLLTSECIPTTRIEIALQLYWNAS